MTNEVTTPSGGQTIFPRVNFLKTFESRFAQRSANGRIFLSDGSTPPPTTSIGSLLFTLDGVGINPNDIQAIETNKAYTIGVLITGDATPSYSWSVKTGAGTITGSGDTIDFTGTADGTCRISVVVTAPNATDSPKEQSIVFLSTPPSPDPIPALELDFANSLSLIDSVSGTNLTTFSRASIGTYVDASGVIQTAANDEARFDHDPDTGESLGLLIEESRTNFVKDNDQVMDARANCSTAFTAGPDGNASSASRVTSLAAGTVNINNATSRSITWTTPNVMTTWSFYIKPSNTTATTVNSACVGGNNKGGATFEWSTLTATIDPGKPDVHDAGIVYAGSGWYRCWTIYNNTLANAAFYRFNVLFTAGGAGEFIDVFGQMVEEGSFPSSYIATSGVVATRAADVCSITGTNFSSWWNDSEGTILAEFAGQTYATDTLKRILSFANSNSTSMSGGEGYWFGSDTGGITEQRWRTRVGSTTTSYNIAATVVKKTAISYDSSGSSQATDGIESQSSTKAVPLTGLNQMNIFPANTSISRIAYYPTRFTEAELLTLTT